MRVLGLFGFGMNPGACLLIDGRIAACAEEERFTRAKAAPGAFPGRATAWCLQAAGLTLGDIDRIAFAWDAEKYPYAMLGAIVRPYLRYRLRAGGGSAGRGRDSNFATVIANLLQFTPARLREEIRLGLRAHGLRGEVPAIEFVPHHLAHAASAYFCSGFDEALVLTLDGSGEDISTQVALGRGERLEVVDSVAIPHSLGWFYAAFTAYFGFTPYRHEGKLMGLAGLGHTRARDNPWPERLGRVLRLQEDAGRYQVDPTFTRFGTHTHAERFTDALAAFVTGHDKRLGPLLPGEKGDDGVTPRYLDPAYVDLAWGVQRRLEEAVCALASHAARVHGARALCVAGGVGLNCKLNGALRRTAPFERVFVQPSCHDAGAAIGAAMLVAQRAGDRVRRRMDHAALGPQWSSAALANLLDDCGLRAERCDDIAARAAQELEQGRLLGWFQGRMEVGPRALGSRSILASPARPGVRAALNHVKERESWRPFCPSILHEASADVLLAPAPAPFMTTAFEVRPELAPQLAAVAHDDGSMRPQTVDASATPLYHRLLTAFRERTGSPLVLNTSLNVNGEPIVCTPREALRCFYGSGLESLALGDFLLSK